MLHTLTLLFSALTVQTPAAPLDSRWGDWNADGREDLLLIDAGRLHLFEDGPSGLREVTRAAGLGAWDGLSGVLWEDLDGDGAADLLLARYSGEGALLMGLPAGGWRAADGVSGLDLARPLSRVRRAGSGLLLEGPDGLRLARLEARVWYESELEFEAAPTATRIALVEDAQPTEDSDGARPAARTGGAALAAGSVTVGGVTSAASLPPLNGICAGFVEDQATSQCLPASSLPILGTLYPLSVDWNVTQTGLVGIGTTTPAAKLDVIGNVRAQQLVSTANALTAPLVVGSSVKVSNLNADRLDGLDSTVFSQLGNSIEGSEISLGTITADRLASPLSASGTAITTLEATASGLTSTALRGTASGGTGNTGVLGESTSTSGLAYGVRGISASSSGRGIAGENSATSGTAIGVYATSASTSGTALQALASATTGNTFGVSATNASESGIAVYGLNTSATGANYAVVGEITSNKGAGVRGNAFAGAVIGPSAGVLGTHTGTFGDAVRGDATNVGTLGVGVRGGAASGSGWGVYSNGDLGASGVKSFVQPHPIDAGKEIRFVCLEGNESGTYFRGTATLIGGQAVVEVPEEFRLVSESEGLTVQISPRGPGRLWIESLDLDQLVVRGDARGFDYFVNGVRRGFGDIELVRENRQWVPELRGVPYGTQYPEALRRILVENGTLNPDFTPNEATAAARGWVLNDPEPRTPPSEPSSEAIEFARGTDSE